MFKILCVSIAFLLTSCTKHYLQVTRIDVNKGSLASFFAKTPDPRKIYPPKGQQLIIEWNLPSSVKDQKLLLELSFIYKDYTEEAVQIALEEPRGIMSYFLLGEEYEEKKGFLTYKAEIKTLKGEVIKSWQEKLWIKLIQLDEEELQ